MIDQQLFNIVFGVAGALGGWWMKAMWDSLKDLQAADRSLAQEVGSLHILVAGNYVRTDTFEKSFGAIFSKLDRIEDKIDLKADKVIHG